MDFLKDAKMYLHETVHKYDDDNFAPDAIAAALIALVEAQRELVAEQRKTNEILVSMIRVEHGSLAAGTALDSFTRHPREDWPGHCGEDDPDWPRDQEG